MKNFFYIIAISIFVSSCSDTEKIFKGELITVKKPTTDKLAGEKLVLNGLYAGYPIVFDSIISFVYPYGDYFVSNFDLNTGKHLGNYFNKGQGPSDFLDFSILHFECNHNLWIHEYNKRQFNLVDMSSGMVKKRIDFSDFKKKGNFPFARVFFLNDSILIAVNMPETKNLNYDIMVPKFRLINYLTKKEIGYDELYDEDVYNKLRGEGQDTEHLAENYRIKPNKSKVVAVMHCLFQINILDLKTGKWKGFRIADTPGFNIVSNPIPLPTYSDVSVDDSFIYAMLNNDFEPDVKPIIHVFDWNGNFVRILEFDQKGTVFDLDNVHKKLYFKDEELEENVWVYDVSYLYQ